jgi:DnaK suppressor protein
MTEEQKQAIKEEILEQLNTLKTTVKDLESEIKPIAPDVSLGRLTRMEAIGSQKMNEAALREAKKKISLLEQALKRLNKNEYGICKHCGAEIPYGRLMMMPETDSCVECLS